MSDNNNNHPAYQNILDALPESLHSTITPLLKEWDAGVTQKIQEVHDNYEGLKGYQQFAENKIDPAYIEQAVILADNLQSDPNKVVSQINSAWGLGFVTPEEAANLKPSEPGGELEEELGLGGEDEVLNHPKVKAMMESLNQLQEEFDSRKQEEESTQELEEFEEYLDNLEKKTLDENLPFNKLFVTALIQQGIDGDDAVKQYHEVLAGAASTEEGSTTEKSGEEAPVVMGNAGTSGSGLPDGFVDFGKATKNQLNSTVEQMLAQAQESGQS